MGTKNSISNVVGFLDLRPVIEKTNLNLTFVLRNC